MKTFSGLTETDAAARLRSEGYNELPEPDRRTPFRIALEVLREPMLALLLVGGIIYLVLGDLKEAIILLVESALDAAPDDVTLTVNLSTERRGVEVAVVVDVVEVERPGAAPPERFASRRRDEWLGLPMAREAVAPFAGRVVIETGQGGARAAIVLPGPS